MRLTACVLLFVLAAAGAGCSGSGYSFREPYSENVRSVAVPMFENLSFEQGLDVHLTEAVVKQINRRTGWAVTGEDRADTVLVGTITAAEFRPLTTASRTGYVQEMALLITVEFQWRDTRTGEILVGRKNVTGSGTFVASRGVGERADLGRYGAVDQLAENIVSELRTAW